MSRTRLNTSLLRRRSEPPRSNPSVSGSRNNLSTLLGGNDPVVSRRRMLGLTGTAIVGASPVLKGARAALSDGFGIAGDEKRLAFTLGGTERWVVEPRRYGRGASLHLERSEKAIRLELRDAFWPGTDLPADFVAEIKRGLTGSRLTITAEALRFRGSVSFESWLLGDATLRSSVRIDRRVTAIGADGAFALHGKGSGEIGADGTLLIDGKKIARLALDGRQSLQADRVAVALLDATMPGLVDDVHTHRTQIHLTRDEHDWMIRPAVTTGTGWNLHAGANIFDRLTIEVGEESGGVRSAALLAEGEGSRDLTFLPTVDGLHGGSTPQFALPLDAPRYAILHDGGSPRTVLVADYPATPVTLRTEGMSLKLGGDATSGTFGLVGEGSELRALDCAPTLLAATLPLKGVVVQPTKPAKPTRLHFFRRENPHPKDAPTDLLPPDTPLPDEGETEEGDVLIDPIKQGVVTFPLKSVIWVLRPADMLYLGFEFMNMKVSSGGMGMRGGAKTSIRSTPELKEMQMRTAITWSAEESLATQITNVKKAPATIVSTGGGTTKKPYLVVHFPPQNIAEQAFWETEPSNGIDQEKPANMVQNSDGVKIDGNGNEVPNLPPIQHRVAGPSRLAFALPSGVTNIPYKLADMLDWSSLIPSVVPAALPPPPPPSKLLGSIMGISESMQGKIASQYTAGGRKSVIMSTSVSRFSSMRTMGDATQVTKHSIRGGYGGTASFNSGQTKAIAARAQVAADDASVKADPDQLMALATENAEAKYGLYLDLTAAIPEIIPPKEYHTAIESPYRLIISPHIFSGWAHASVPVTHDGKTELWHTRLGSRTTSGAVDEKDDYYRTIRAVWSPDFAPNPDNGPASNNLPFRMSLNGRDRNELVHLSANYKYPKGTKWVPEHIDVDRLMLSPLGAWMNVRGAWEPPAGLSIEEWRHRGTMGRDHYVRVVYKGFLFPFGNRASLVKVTERKIRKFGRHGYIAYMYQRMYIVVRKPIKEYPALGQPYDSRRTPFRRIRLTTLVTPNLDRPDTGSSKIGSYGDEAFWPGVDGKDFVFNIVADDWEGNQIEFSTPLAFVNNKKAFDYAVTQAVVNTYSAERRKRDLHGSKVAYAPSDKPGDTSFETEYVKFVVDVPTSDTKNTGAPNALPKVSAGTGSNSNANNDDLYAADQPYFYPAFEETKVRIDAVEQITGTPAFKEITLHEAYYKHGISGSQNKGQVFAKLKEEVGLSFSANADKAGGLATPNMNIGGLSRSLGTVGGKVEDAVSGKFDPTSFFDEALDANLLGGISLRDIIDAVNDFGGDLIKIPRMLNQKNFENPKAMLSSLQSLASAVNDVKNDIDTFKEMKDELDDAIGDIESLPDTIDEAAQDIAEQARQKALGIIQEVEKEVKGIINQAAGYAQSVVDKVKDIADSDSLAGLLESLGLPTELTLELKWGPTIKSWPNSDNPNDLMGSNALFQALNASGNPVEVSNEVLYIRAALTVKLDGSAPSFVLEGVANNFEIRLIPIKDAAPEGFVHLKFDDLSFRSKDAAKPDVNVEFNPDTGITFHGPLAFVEKIREFIPFDGFSDPPSLDVSPTGITAGFTLPLPTIAVGVFSLQNISLGASLELPFTNSPLVFTFMFCTRENPFMLTISMLGGGGYFALIISTKEIGFEAALEFGGSFAFDIGVASGGVYIKAGVYYKKMGEEVMLEGYLKLGGSLEVLGLITISVDFYMSLTYQEPGGKVIGQATLTVKIEILFFSVSVELHVERRFKGSANDPLFIDLMKQNHWDEYCDAFATIA